MRPITLLAPWLILAAGVDIEFGADRPAVDWSGQTCIALAIFSEARSEPEAGRAAVGQVIVNRATDSRQRWPATLCGSVLEPGQFVGVEGWKYPRVARERDYGDWRAALDMADQIIAGTAPVPVDCQRATSFNQGSRPPGFVALCRIGVHTFYAEP